jgi:hypothetical protein
MSLIHKNSCECAKSELEIFDINPTQTQIEESFYVKYYPLTSVDKANGPIEFKVIASANTYCDPATMVLYTKNRIVDDQGNALPAPEGEAAINRKSLVYPINYFHATRFKNVEVWINNKSVTDNNSLYAYRAFFEMLLSCDSATKRDQISAGMFFKESGDLDAVPATQAQLNQGNPSVIKRFNATKYSKAFEMIGRVHTEICNQEKLLILNNTELKIKFHPHDFNFSLICSKDGQRYNVIIDEAILYVEHKKIASSVLEAHEMALQLSNAKFNIRRVEMKYFTKGPNRSDIQEPNLVNGVLPRRLVFGLVKNESFVGSYNSNPLNFQHFQVRQIIVRVNGQAVPFESIDVDFPNNSYMQGYLSLLHGLNDLHSANAFDISPHEDYINGHTLYAVDLTPDRNPQNFNLIKEGNIGLEIKLGATHSHSISVIVYLEYDHLLQITKNKNVLF